MEINNKEVEVAVASPLVYAALWSNSYKSRKYWQQ